MIPHFIDHMYISLGNVLAKDVLSVQELFS